MSCQCTQLTTADMACCHTSFAAPCVNAAFTYCTHVEAASAGREAGGRSVRLCHVAVSQSQCSTAVVLSGCRVDVVSPQLAVQQGFWSVPITSVGLTWPNGSSNTPAGACAGFTGGTSTNTSSSQAGCIGILDSGTAQIIGSIDQVAALNAALGGVPSIKQLPFDCGQLVAAVLDATAQALSSSNPNAAANQVSQAAVQCGLHFERGTQYGAVHAVPWVNVQLVTWKHWAAAAVCVRVCWRGACKCRALC